MGAETPEVETEETEDEAEVEATETEDETAALQPETGQLQD